MRKLIWVALLLAMMPIAQAKMYKWVDEHGATHFGDNVPPQYQNQVKEIDKSGREIKTGQTPEERKAREEEKLRQKKNQEQHAEQKRIDNALLGTYSNEREIDLKRDRDLQQVEAAIASVGMRMKAVKAKLADYRRQEEALVQKKKPVPQSLADDIASTEAERQHLQDMLTLRQREKDEVYNKYEGYKKRFIELHRSEQATPPAKGSK
ncbi:MAG: DUF4124 domain-containing protein [Pseudomonadota bacterium]